jgi:hypothetical protein
MTTSTLETKVHEFLTQKRIAVAGARATTATTRSGI